MIIGQYSPGIYFQVCALSIGLGLILIYHINQYLGHNKPFPHTLISDVARHYPQFVFFRIATISGSVLMALGWFTNHFYLKTIALENHVSINKYKPQIVMILGMMGSFLLMGSTANLDTGHQNTTWHVYCATLFFYFTMSAQILNTLLYLKLSYSFNIVNKPLLYLKIVQSAFLLTELYLDTKKSYFLTNEKSQNDDVLGIIIEWVATYTILIGFIIMSFDVYKFKYVYEALPHQNTKTINQQGTPIIRYLNEK